MGMYSRLLGSKDGITFMSCNLWFECIFAFFEDTTNEDYTVDDTGSGERPALTSGPPVGAFVGVGSGGVSVSTWTRWGSFVSVGSTPGSNPFDYTYAISQTRLHDDSNVALFFLDKDLKPGKTVTLHFTKSSNRVPFFRARLRIQNHFRWRACRRYMACIQRDPTQQKQKWWRTQ